MNDSARDTDLTPELLRERLKEVWGIADRQDKVIAKLEAQVQILKEIVTGKMSSWSDDY
jgi:hypothetical protein